MNIPTPFQKLSKQEKLDRNAGLAKSHAMYRDYNQRRSNSSEHLASKGHPMASLYRVAAKLFFSLYYCCNASSRLMASNNSGSEQIRMDLPHIRERWHGYVLINEQPFYGIYPSHPDYEKTIEAFAAAGFPNSTASASCLFTTLTVKTNTADVIDALYRYQSEHPSVCIRRDGSQYSITLDGLKNELPKVKVLRGLVALLKTLYKPYLLPTGSADCDERPLPLAERPMLLGNVKEVTIRPLTVLFPLIAIGDTEHQLRVVNQVVRLLESGYPLSADVESYLSRLVTEKTLKDLKKRFNQ